MKKLPKQFLDRLLIRLSKLLLPFFILFWVTLPTWGQPAAPLGIAAPSGTVQVPNLVGQNKAQAATILNQARLRTGRVNPVSSNQPQDTIVQQFPVAGQRVKAGDLVNIWVSTGKRQTDLVRVPNLIRRNEQQAQELLGNNRLQLGRVTGKQSDLPQGTIIRQSPAAGREVKAGSPVDVWVSTGQQQTDLVRVPILVRKNEQQAQDLLGNNRLQLGRVTGKQSNLPQGTIIQQSPAAGQQVKVGSPVDVWVSLGPVQVPNLVGLNEQQARQLLGDSRLGLVVADQVQGPIVRQAPTAGQSVPMGSSVRVWRRQTPPRLVEVPPLIGHNQNEAAGILTPKNLHVGQVTRRQAQEPAGTIIEQNPAAGAPVQPRIGVNLVVSTGPPPPADPERIDVPEVRGKPLEQAKRMLIEARLTPGRVEKRESDQRDGTVTHQSPGPGTQLEAGRPVNLVVARPSIPPISPVPPVRPDPSEVPWHLVILAISAVLGTAYGLFKLFKGPPLPALKVRVVQRMVKPEVASDSPRLADLEVRLRPIRDQGQQSISIEAGGSLILEERKENE